MHWFLFLLLVWCGSVYSQVINRHGVPLVPDGKGYVRPGKKKLIGPRVAPVASGYGITYHGGKVMDGTVNIYYVWYGNWAGNTATTILSDIVTGLDGSSYQAINTLYSTSAQQVTGSVKLAGVAYDSYSLGNNLTDAAIYNVVANAIKSGKLAKDDKGVYFVLSSQDVNATSGLCRSYCGWHSYNYVAGTQIKYAYVGNPARCPYNCAGQWSKSPNNNPAADAMASAITHELNEIITDPFMNAWYDATARENGDKCAWTFGTRYLADNGSLWNVQLGARKFYLQQNWINAQKRTVNGLVNGWCGVGLW